jgi:superfamily II DNA or RNA helicase
MNRQTPRGYQVNAVQSVLDAYEDGYRRVLYTQATGTGKTTTFSELIRHFLERGWKTLVLAHRTELIAQAYERIKEHNDLSVWQIGMEIASVTAPRSAVVVVGSVMTVKSANRLDWFTPDVVIVDECHRSAGASYISILKRAGVDEGRCFYVGCTATARRTDRQSLFAIRPNGERVTLTDKHFKQFEADTANCVFEKHVSEYTITAAMEDGWLVPMLGHSVQTGTDLSKIKTIAGDFAQGQLEKAITNAIRTNIAINAWKEIAADRQTLVFCAGVEHAHHAAEMWTAAGYTACAIDGVTDKAERHRKLLDFKQGRLQVICNCGVFTEGTDLPMCSAIVHLRPTKAWNLYVQMTGRGMRTLPGVVDDTMTAAERRAAIAASGKPNCIVLDLVDITKENDLCATPSLLDLPSGLDLQGQSVTDVKKMMDEFEDVKEQVIGQCPLTYQDLAVKLAHVSLIRESGANTKSDWAATEDGFRWKHSQPGYQTNLNMPEPNVYELEVTRGTEVILSKKSKRGQPFKAYIDNAARRASEAIERHKEEHRPSRGTLMRLSTKQIRVLKNYHSLTEIDAMPYAKAQALIGNYMQAWQTKRGD